ncbi:Clp protease N-terminal domain-containing protein, partial [Roseisolibacter sp. H3M3-2]|uniref:Clp protease N-terminal domain-containing protein n=1 Tax=Roseisolibacter sp. H3M3-2 TaxID=3031323 RepID=UPI0023DA5A72
MSVTLRALIGKLNPAMRSTIEAAAGLCLSRTHYDVEIEHVLVKALDAADGDVAQILKHYGVNRARLADDLARGLDRLKSGNARTPSLSPSLVRMLTEAWTVGSIEFGAAHARSGHAVLALVGNDELKRLAADISRELEKIPAEALRKDFATITAPSSEAAAELRAADAAPAGAAAGAGGATA